MPIPVNLDCTTQISQNNKVCINNNVNGIKECGDGYCCGNITDLSSNNVMNCNICGLTTVTGGD